MFPWHTCMCVPHGKSRKKVLPFAGNLERAFVSFCCRPTFVYLTSTTARTTPYDEMPPLRTESVRDLQKFRLVLCKSFRLTPVLLRHQLFHHLTGVFPVGWANKCAHFVESSHRSVCECVFGCVSFLFPILCLLPPATFFVQDFLCCAVRGNIF